MIELKANIKVTKEYSGKSKFTFWNDLRIGDVMTITHNLGHIGGNRGYMYSPTIVFTVNDIAFSSSYNTATNYLSKIGFEKYDS